MTASSFFSQNASRGGVAEKPRELGVGDPTTSYKIQADFEAFRARVFLPFDVAGVSLLGRLRVSVRVPLHVFPWRSFRISIAGQYPTSDPAPMTKVQRAILDWLGRLVLAREVGEDRGSLEALEDWEREVFG